MARIKQSPVDNGPRRSRTDDDEVRHLSCTNPQRSPFFSLCASMTNNGETDNVDLSMDEKLLDIRELRQRG